jgi:hypothetical protein
MVKRPSSPNCCLVAWAFFAEQRPISDININILNQQDSAEYLNIMLMTSGLKSELNEPTRDDSCLDHVMVRGQHLQIKTSILENNVITDHLPIHIKIINENTTVLAAYGPAPRALTRCSSGVCVLVVAVIGCWGITSFCNPFF